MALLELTLNEVPAPLVTPEILLPDPAEKDPSNELRLTPVVELFVLVIDRKGRLFALTVLRSTAGPPTAATVATPDPTAIWNPADPV